MLKKYKSLQLPFWYILFVCVCPRGGVGGTWFQTDGYVRLKIMGKKTNLMGDPRET